MTLFVILLIIVNMDTIKNSSATIIEKLLVLICVSFLRCSDIIGNCLYKSDRFLFIHFSSMIISSNSCIMKKMMKRKNVRLFMFEKSMMLY